VKLYYDSALIVSTDTSKKDSPYINFTKTEARIDAYVVPTGISVALDLRFPESDSVITLFSVTLIYKAIQGLGSIYILLVQKNMGSMLLTIE
jgi:hypothetical protein